MVCQHDPRHVDVLVKEFGLESANAVQTPEADDAAEEISEPLVCEIDERCLVSPEHVPQRVYFTLFLSREVFSRLLSCRCCPQWSDVQALVMRFCVQLLLKSGATMPSSLNTVKR